MDKWYAIAVIVFLVAVGVSLSVESYTKAQCRIEAVKVGKTAEDIEKICR